VAQELEKKCSKVRAARATLLLFFVNRPIKFIFCGIAFTVTIVSAKVPSMKLTRLSFVCLACLSLYPYPLMSKNARLDEVSEIVKIGNKALHFLVGDFDNFANFASNQQVNANDKTRGPFCKWQTRR